MMMHQQKWPGMADLGEMADVEHQKVMSLWKFSGRREIQVKIEAHSAC